MLITNETHWRTDQLKAIIQQVSLTALEGFEKRKKRLKITIVYSRKGGYHGCVNGLGGTTMTLRIPKEEVDKPQFAWLVDHEMGHVRGQDHRQMTQAEMYWSVYLNPDDDNDNRCTSDVNDPKYAWAKTFPLERKNIPAKPLVNLQEVRYNATLAAITRWEAKMNGNEMENKRIKKELAKLKDRKRYYEKEVFSQQPQKETV